MSNHLWRIAIVFASAALARSALKDDATGVGWNAEAAPLGDLDYSHPPSTSSIVAGRVLSAQREEIHRLASELGGHVLLEQPAEE